MANAYGYSRRSDEDKDKEEYSLENQKFEIQKFCNQNNHNLVEMFEEGYFKSTMWKTPKFDEMMEKIRNGADVQLIVIRHSSRFSRDFAKVEIIARELQAYGIKLMLTDGTDLTKENLRRRFEGLINYQVIEDGRKYQKEMMVRKSEQGGMFGRPPLGYVTQKTLVNNKVKIVWNKDDTKAKIVVDIFDKFVNQKLPSTFISKQLNMPVVSILKILKNKTYIGIFEHKIREKYSVDGQDKNKEVGNNSFKIKEIPALIQKDIFYKAQEIIKSRSWKR